MTNDEYERGCCGRVTLACDTKVGGGLTGTRECRRHAVMSTRAAITRRRRDTGSVKTLLLASVREQIRIPGSTLSKAKALGEVKVRSHQRVCHTHSSRHKMISTFAQRGTSCDRDASHCCSRRRAPLSVLSYLERAVHRSTVTKEGAAPLLIVHLTVHSRAVVESNGDQLVAACLRIQTRL